MIRTLHLYLVKDLLKATALAVAVLTLMFTVFVIIEPLRDRGLSGQQALRLFSYSLPVMLSLTLPVAALFATTIVYGRFSQDNELMACRASGISTLTLLKPAVCLGLAVSAVTLALAMYVAPRLLSLSQKVVKANLKSIAYHGLRSRNYVALGSRIVHVDRADPQSGWVAGVVGVDFSNPEDAKAGVAANAKLDFLESEGTTLVQFHSLRPALFSQSGATLGMAEEQRVLQGELPNLFQDEPKMYDWDMLRRTWAQPRDNAKVREEVMKVRQQLCIQRFYEEVIQSLRTSGAYDRLSEFAPPEGQAPAPRFVLHALEARLSEDGQEVLVGPAAPVKTSGTRPAVVRPVEVSQFVGDRPRRHFWAGQARVKAVWDNFRKAAVVTLVLLDVNVHDAADAPERGRRQDQHELGPLAVPADIARSAEAVELDDLFDFPEKYAAYPRVKTLIENLHRNTVARLLRKVQAEMHQRLALGAGCLLMVMLGAALGLILRGGQMLTAFAISAVLVLIMAALLSMGKQMIANPGVPAAAGIAAVWGGTVAMTAVTAWLYAGPMRQ